MKSIRPTPSPGPDTPPPPSRRAPGRKASSAAAPSSSKKGPSRSTSPGRKTQSPAAASPSNPSEGSLAGAVEPRGSIRMDLTAQTPRDLQVLLYRIERGLDDNPNYADLEATRLRLARAEAALSARLQHLAALDAEWQSNRAALETEVQEGRDALRQAARACEAADPCVGALASAGWELRRPSGPPQLLPAPAHLRGQPDTFAGQACIRWSRVPNAHAYEFQTCPGEDPGLLASSPSRPLFQVKTLLSGQIPGSAHLCRVRALGAKGPSPWSMIIGVRVGVG